MFLPDLVVTSPNIQPHLPIWPQTLWISLVANIYISTKFWPWAEIYISR